MDLLLLFRLCRVQRKILFELALPSSTAFLRIVTIMLSWKPMCTPTALDFVFGDIGEHGCVERISATIADGFEGE